jgi:hypothetical protein
MKYTFLNGATEEKVPVRQHKKQENIIFSSFSAIREEKT